jgi:hypothetical protein
MRWPSGSAAVKVKPKSMPVAIGLGETQFDATRGTGGGEHILFEPEAELEAVGKDEHRKGWGTVGGGEAEDFFVEVGAFQRVSDIEQSPIEDRVGGGGHFRISLVWRCNRRSCSNCQFLAVAATGRT